jgi:hypothetical protein
LNIYGVVKGALDVSQRETEADEKEKERSSQLNYMKCTLPSDLASLNILSVNFPTLLAFIMPISS